MIVKWLAMEAKVNRLTVFQSAIKRFANATASAPSSSSSISCWLSPRNFLLMKSFNSGPNGKKDYVIS